MENSSLYLLHVLHVQPAIASVSQEHVQTNMIDLYMRIWYTEQIFILKIVDRITTISRFV